MFSQNDFSSASVELSAVFNNSFRQSTFSGATVSICESDNLDFTEANFTGATVNIRSSTKMVFRRGNFTGATVSICESDNLDFTEADFTGATVVLQTVRHSTFQECKFLVCTDIHIEHVEYCVFDDASFVKSKVKIVECMECSFSQVDFRLVSLYLPPEGMFTYQCDFTLATIHILL